MEMAVVVIDTVGLLSCIKYNVCKCNNSHRNVATDTEIQPEEES